MNGAFWGLLGFAWPLSWVFAMCRTSALLGRRVPPRDFLWGWVATSGTVAALAGTGGYEAAEIGALASAGVALYLLLDDWWKRRGKRTARQLGAKSRALLDSLAGRMRDSAQPAPEGARA